MPPLISVIIPVYKVEAYLPACVESVLAQTYSNLEIILVDDGSPDSCPGMCDGFAERDSRIQVIHKENGGLSSARNTGIDAARGDFLAFLDSDDLWSPLFLEHLYRAAAQTGADLAVCRFQRFRGEAAFHTGSYAAPELLSPRAAFECFFNERNVNMVVAWNKLYRKELFRALRYPVGRLHEDEAVIHEIIGSARSVAWLEEALYYYREAPNSITTAKFNLRRLDETLAKEDRIAYFETRGMRDLADRTRVAYLSNLMRLYRTVQSQLSDGNEKEEACAHLYRRFCQIHSAKLVADAPLPMRVRCRLFRWFPVFFSKLENARLKGRETV